jgi:hypothetical protein
MLKKTNSTLFFVTVGLLLCCSLTSAAQDRGAWRAASPNAASITGDLTISGTKVTINFAGFTIAQIRKLQPSELNAVFQEDQDPAAAGNLYRMNVPPDKRFLHHNTLCGSDETQWMVTYATARSLEVAFFSGSDMPVLSTDALAKSTDLCGTFSYVR